MTNDTQKQYDFSVLKNEFAMMWDGGDKWGSCLSWQFAICDELCFRGEHDNLLADVQYSPGITDDPRDFERLEAEVCKNTQSDALEKMLLILERYSKLLKKHGEDY